MLIEFTTKRHARTSHGRKPKRDGSAVVSFFANSAEKTKKSSQGRRPLAFQLETAEGPTPASLCAVSAPNASITDSTDVNIILDTTSRGVNMSSVHISALETVNGFGTIPPMPIARKTLPKRLRMTLDALGKSQADVCKATGLKANRLSQYCSGERNLTLDAAVKIRDAYGVPLDWLFMADPSGLRGDLHQKLAKSEVA